MADGGRSDPSGEVLYGEGPTILETEPETSFKVEEDSQVKAAPTAQRINSRSRPLIPWILLLLLVAALGYWGFQFGWPLFEERDALRLETEKLRDEKNQLVNQVKTLQNVGIELDAAKRELAAAMTRKDEELASMQATQEELNKKLEEEIKKGDVLIRSSKGELVVDLVDKILFDSGDATLSEAGKTVLLRVGETFKKATDQVIQVGGHTDNIPISPKLRTAFPSNWELSTARSTNVARFLQDSAKIPGERLVASGYGEYRPIAGNKTAQGRKRNRRIEIILLPKVK